ncbi:MAG TPA: hypothetical protein VM899_17065, partial [Rubellimicrobium sp.]|nr:hypothetical protein [Rubellimicrobium sp.]
VERELDGDGRVHRAAARPQDVEANLRGKRIGGRDHLIRRLPGDVPRTSGGGLGRGGEIGSRSLRLKAFKA